MVSEPNHVLIRLLWFYLVLGEVLCICRLLLLELHLQLLDHHVLIGWTELIVV